MRLLIEEHRDHYNNERVHTSLGYLTSVQPLVKKFLYGKYGTGEANRGVRKV